VSELAQREDVSVATDDDVVVFTVGKHAARFSYHSAFLIAQRLRLSANVAGRLSGCTRQEVTDMKRQPVHPEQVSEVILDDGHGAHGNHPWEVRAEGELVVFQISDQIIQWSAPAAMEIAAWFREAGKQAKRWAGDTSRTLNIAGILTDANANASLN
jgi:hypothetical protein